MPPPSCTFHAAPSRSSPRNIAAPLHATVNERGDLPTVTPGTAFADSTTLPIQTAPLLSSVAAKTATTHAHPAGDSFNSNGESAAASDMFLQPLETMSLSAAKNRDQAWRNHVEFNALRLRVLAKMI